MKDVAAPPGFEGCVFYEDGARSWRASVRPIGGMWWTNCGYCGHAQTDAKEVAARAEASIAQYISQVLVK